MDEGSGKLFANYRKTFNSYLRRKSSPFCQKQGVENVSMEKFAERRILRMLGCTCFSLMTSMSRYGCILSREAYEKKNS